MQIKSWMVPLLSSLKDTASMISKQNSRQQQFVSLPQSILNELRPEMAEFADLVYIRFPLCMVKCQPSFVQRQIDFTDNGLGSVPQPSVMSLQNRLFSMQPAGRSPPKLQYVPPAVSLGIPPLLVFCCHCPNFFLNLINTDSTPLITVSISCSTF